MNPMQVTKRPFITDTKILENNRHWRRTYNGLTTVLYVRMRERSKRNGKQNGEFTLAEFKAWLSQTNIRELYEQWERCGYLTDARPSIDRIDVLRGYTFDNMQVITAKENRVKGDAEKIILWGKPVRQLSMSGLVIAEYPNLKTAMEITNIDRGRISTAIHGKGKRSAGGYRWELIENSKLLKN